MLEHDDRHSHSHLTSGHNRPHCIRLSGKCQRPSTPHELDSSLELTAALSVADLHVSIPLHLLHISQTLTWHPNYLEEETCIHSHIFSEYLVSKLGNATFHFRDDGIPSIYGRSLLWSGPGPNKAEFPDPYKFCLETSVNGTHKHIKAMDMQNSSYWTVHPSPLEGYGDTPSVLVVKDDGNLVLYYYAPGAPVLWSARPLKASDDHMQELSRS